MKGGVKKIKPTRKDSEIDVWTRTSLDRAIAIGQGLKNADDFFDSLQMLEDLKYEKKEAVMKNL
jgi:hypothetical protein